MRLYICRISDFSDFDDFSLLTKEREVKMSRYLKK